MEIYNSYEDFRSYRGTDPGWGHKPRRVIFWAACKYLGINPNRAESIFGVGFHSIFQSNAVQLSGNILEDVKQDPAILRTQQIILKEIKSDTRYKIKEFNDSGDFSAQLGGQRAREEMWKQALEFWKWTSDYRTTWESAFNELTWTVRSVKIYYDYVADMNGKISIQYHFSDRLDLRPDWGYRSMEYNAICVVLGFLYHDVLGGSDELQIQADWKAEFNAIR